MSSDTDIDVAVLGTGAAGLTAAVAAHEHGASVGLFERADEVGGTSAWSGGMVWIPRNHHMAALGIDDSREDVLTYLGSLSHGTISDDLAEAFVDGAPEALAWLEANTPASFDIIPDFPDYHPEHPGAKPGGGRSLECPLFPFDELGEWAAKVTVGAQLSGNIVMAETSLGRGAPGGVAPDELARRRLRDERGAGQALVGRLLKACLDRGIEPRTGMRATHLLTSSGRISGVRFDGHGGTVEVPVRQGVVLATGGFDWDPELVAAFLRGPLERSAAVPTNTGDGLRMAMRVGAALGNMREAWWVPMIDVERPGRGTVAWQVNGERARPHCIIVNGRGDRFANEAANYNAFGAAFHVIDVNRYDYINHPAWMLFDGYYLERFGLAGHTPAEPTPAWLIEAPTIGKLASCIGIEPGRLEGTVERFGEHARAGRDPDYGRGDSVHDRWWGDPDFDGPAATLGPLDTPPFYAVQVRSGALGTKGGPRTSGDAEVLDVDGSPIAGLYAAGNVMASALGMTYGGPGGTLGPAITFGFRAGRHCARATPVG
jgi:3-oxosteroid 1-dehydrogenase